MAQLEAIKKAVAEALSDCERVIAYGRGFDALHATPLHVKSEADLEKLVWDRTCVHVLPTDITRHKGKKVGIVVKGCDSRSIVQLMQEGLIDKEEVHVIGVPCDGVLSLDKLRREMDIDAVESVEENGDTIKITAGGETREFKLADVVADKCQSCQYPNPLVSDATCGEPLEAKPAKDVFARLDEFEALPESERYDFWLREMDRCIRCYACRNACPLCVCQDHCIAETRQPKWQSAEGNVREKWFFQMIHASHLTGRCTLCGECERACPMDIPVLLFKQKTNKSIKDVFGYEAGINPEAIPPLATFKVEEETIDEKEW